MASRKDGDQKAARAELRCLQAELTRAREASGEDEPTALLREFEAGLTRSPPAGVRPEYMAGFFARNRGRLLNIVAGVLNQIG